MDEGDNAQHIPKDPRFKHYHFDRIDSGDRLKRGSCGLLPKDKGLDYATGEFVTFPSDDIYYVNTFVEDMIAFQSLTKVDFAYCRFIFNYTGYRLQNTTPPIMGNVDVCNYILRKSAIGKVRFAEWAYDPDKIGQADGYFIEKIIANGATYASNERILMVHN